MAYTKAQIAAIHADLDVVLKKFAEDHGLVAGASHIRYSASDFKVSVQFGDKSANPEAIDPRFLTDLERRGHQFDLDKSMVGTEVKTSKGMVKFVGMRASKAVVMDTDSKIWLYDATIMSAMLKTAMAAKTAKTNLAEAVVDNLEIANKAKTK